MEKFATTSINQGTKTSYDQNSSTTQSNKKTRRWRLKKINEAPKYDYEPNPEDQNEISVYDDQEGCKYKLRASEVVFKNSSKISGAYKHTTSSKNIRYLKNLKV